MQTLTKTLTGAQILIETLKKLGVDSIFGYPGGIVLSVYDELSKQEDIKHYLVRHEQAAVHAAEGYARASGKCGVVLVTSGPGATNVVTGVADAYLDGTPLVVFTGQVMSNLLHQDAFQEVDILDITKSCTKKNYQVSDVKELESTVLDAFKTAMSGRQGPVVVDLTKNIFSEVAEFSSVDKIEFDVSHINEQEVKNVLDEILNSKAPVIISGGGVIQAGASNELLEFSKLLAIPVVSSMMGIGGFPCNNENYLGMLGIFGNNASNQAVKNSDLVIALGTRLNDRIRCCFNEAELSKKLVHIDISPNEIARIIKPHMSLVGDIKSVLNKMLDILKSDRVNASKYSKNNWLAQAVSLKTFDKEPLKRSENLHSFEVMKEIQDCIADKNLTVVTEVGQHQVWAARYLKFLSPRKFITSGGLGTMGFGFPASIGASVASNNQPVICIAGDGSFQMNLQEIATCVDYNIPVIVIIFDNNYLGMVRQFQEKMCNQRYFATKISNPDFIKLAQSYGIDCIRVDSVNQIKSAIETAYASRKPFLIDVKIEPMELL